MNILCPECREPLNESEKETARCEQHGGEFKVLFSRGSSAPLEAAQAQAAPSESPAGAPADGRFASPSVARSAFEGASIGAPCSGHPNVPAVHTCRLCTQPMCATCTFELPQKLRICPRCMIAPRPALGPSRRNWLVTSFLLATWSCIAFVGYLVLSVMYAHDPAMRQTLGIGFSFLVLFPSICGLGAAIGTYESRLNNPGWIWLSIAWNSAVMAFIVLLLVLGLMAK